MQRSSFMLANQVGRQIAAATGFLICFLGSALAHDIYTDLHDRDGNLCCGRQDCMPWGLQCCQMAVTSYQGLVRLFPQTWQCHHLIIASTIVSIIQRGMSGKDPRLNASLLQCTLSRPGTPFNKFLNERSEYAHARAAGDVVLPFIGVGMPVRFA
jgi:hypothetical protein